MSATVIAPFGGRIRKLTPIRWARLRLPLKGGIMNPTASRFAVLMGSASLLTLTNALTAHAQMTAQAAPEAIPEQVLVTGSLIHGTAAVGVPVTNLGTQDFA